MSGMHKGYLYQDLLAAFVMAENLHKKDFKIAMECKEKKDDLFDDIVFFADGKKSKMQVKHTHVNRKLTKSSFVNKSSDVYLENLAKSFLTNENANYILITNKVVQADPYFVGNSKLKRLSLPSKTFSINIAAANNKNFIKHLSIESDIPDASFDLSKPGSLEKELFESLRLNVGVGYYPNNQVSTRDVAARLILLASEQRASTEMEFIDRDFIFKRIGLNFEYGHISQIFPFISSEHRLFRNKTLTKVKNLIDGHKFIVLEGLPGSGKSHIFDDLSKQLSKSEGFIVARHFCYLEPTDKFAQDRILVDAMYGNFFHQLEKLKPEIAKEIRPYFAATKASIEKFIDKTSKSGEKVVLMVDGLDHLNRVVAQNKLSPDLVVSFIADLLDLRVPNNCTVFIASQSTAELKEIIKRKRARVYSLEPWDEILVEKFAIKHNNHLPKERKFKISPEVIKSLTVKTEGNPLYLTYILKEIISVNHSVDIPLFIKDLPKLNSDLNNYYKYLVKNANSNDLAVIQTLALLDFSVTNDELCEMFPPIQKRSIHSTINKVSSILKPGLVQGGITIYHESFRRFIIELGREYKTQDHEMYKHITGWLEKKGFFQSQRAYRYLIPYFVRSNDENKAYELLGKDFVAQSLFYFHGVKSIFENLNKIAGSAAQKQRWDMYCKSVELRRSLFTFSEERLEYVDDVYHKAILDVHGVKMFCERMLFDGKRTFSKTYGILLCQMAEHSGGNPPWSYYDVGGVSISVSDDSQILHYQKVGAAHFLSLIRKSSVRRAISLLQKMISKNSYPGTEKRQINMLLEEFDFIFGVVKYYKKLTVLRVSKKKKDFLYLGIASYLYKNAYRREASRLSTEVIAKTKKTSLIFDGILSGGSVSKLKISSDIIELTKQILSFDGFYSKEAPIFNEWYRTVQILSHVKPSLIKKAQNIVNNIDGWYRAWISYIFDLSLLETSKLTTIDKEKLLLNSLKELNRFAHPFRGEPRAMDLYGIRDLSSDSFKRTLAIASKFSNYSEIIDLLSDISKKTTARLQGSSDGPLSGESFNALLKEEYHSFNNGGKNKIEKLLQDNTIDGISFSDYYDSYSFEYLKLATIYSMTKKTKKAKECLMEGCVRLAAYGHRKDVTIFEIVDPIEFIAVKNLQFACSAFRRSYPLVETVWRHTDGSETKWGLISWIKGLINSDIKISIQVLSEMVAKDSKLDWRIEIGTEYLCEKLLVDNINSLIIADLYETIDRMEDTRFDVSVGLKIAEELLNKKETLRAQKLFDFICNTLYWLSIDAYSEKDNFSKMVKFAKKFNLKIQGLYIGKFREESRKPKSPGMPPPYKAKQFVEKIPRLALSNISVAKFRKIANENELGRFLHSKNVHNFSNFISKLETKYPDAVCDIVLSLFRRNTYLNENTKGLVALRDFLKSKGKTELAAFVSMLGFIYVRGGNGWYALADSKYNYLGRDAFGLSKNVAEKVLANEMAYIFSKSTYLTGPSRHLIEFFPSNGNTLEAQKIWDSAYEVIKFRLPMHPDLSETLTNETPSFSYKKTRSVTSLLNELILNRKNITP
ncbi:TPA: hypothetical protein DIC62_01420 [Candidatus Nomurabacteria bacterium]|nr:hypothetical protein [Candidatus Nomurabacteria bacterium]